jgi:hypothetical protein
MTIGLLQRFAAKNMGAAVAAAAAAAAALHWGPALITEILPL